MRSMGIAIAVLIGSCIDPGAARCGELICPVGLVCASNQDRCVQSEQNDVCEGLAESAECTFGTTVGVCSLGTCLEFRCANGVVEAGEVCDDGNARSGDGCSGDCASDETCGNGVTDSRTGEMCDDGNTLSGDGCQENCALPRCGDAVVDEGEVCDDGNFDDADGCNARCSSDESCGNGVIDVAVGEECDDGNLEVGDSCGATCQIEVCGNGVVDPAELCDDGNTVGGDGCGADCTSDEVCGNGILDAGSGEQCDDGNLRSRDGCSSLCTVEVPAWLGQEARGGPVLARMPFHAARGGLVVVGGSGGGGEGNIRFRERRNDQWVRLEETGQPSTRSGHIAVYDAARRQILVACGAEPLRYMGGVPLLGSPRTDAYALGENGWTTAPAPPTRVWAEAVYDPAAERIVLFGGEAAGEALNETWVFDGGWRELSPATSPTPRTHHGMAYDIARGVIVMAGGVDDDGARLDDTWEFDGVTWREVETAPITTQGQLVYDTRRSRVLLYGGSGLEPSNELWSFDGASWTLLSIEGPPRRLGASIAYDPLLGGLVVRGGGASVPAMPFNDTWVFTESWTRLIDVDLPSRRRVAGGGVYDPRSESVFMIGGELGPPTSDMWTYRSSGWRAEGPLPVATRVTGAVYDAARRQVLFVTAAMGDAELSTWVRRGETWRRLAIAGPPARRDSVLAYDSTNDVVLMYGGEQGAMLNDLWEFDGEWRERMTTNAPPPRRFPSIAFDAGRGTLVIAGGNIRGTLSDEVWELEGSTWTRSPTRLPSPGGQLVYYPPTSALWSFRFAPNMAGIWERSGEEWLPRAAPNDIGARTAPAIIFDRVSKNIVVVGGDPNVMGEELRLGSSAPDEVCSSEDDVDNDGVAQCADPDCNGQRCGEAGERCIAGACVCELDAELSCEDGYDDDCDGLVDCADPDCGASTYCGAEDDCRDGLDDDGDGPIDCADPGCLANPMCEPQESMCGDGVDNDGDGRADCADLDCYLSPCEDVVP